MLVIWVFALAAGVVNACALTPAGLEERGGMHADATVPASHRDKGEQVGHHGHQRDSGKDSCLRFCDDESSAITKVKLPVVDLGLTLLTAAEPWSSVVAAIVADLAQSPERPASQGPPLVIRFLRLTL